MKSYAFALQKGGTGKTSISVSVAVEMARQGKKVVYIDCDPQGNSSSWLLDDFENELADILYGKVPVLECVYASGTENLFVIPTFGVGGTLKQFSLTEHYPFIFKNQILPELAKHFDYCIFDTSPAFNEFEKSIFIASDEVVPVLKLDEFSKDGWEIFTENLRPVEAQYGVKPVFKTIVLNQQDKRIKTQSAYLSAFNDLNDAKKFSYIIIPTDPAFSKSQSIHSTIYDRRIAAKADTISAISELVRRLM